MSELNKKKKSSLFKFTVFYSIIIITITIILMFNYKKTGIDIISTFINNKNANQNEVNEIFNNENIIEYSEEIYNKKEVDLLDKYYLNNIEFIPKTLNMGNIMEYDFSGEPIYKLRATYFEIDGLKNNTIENEINKKIKNTVEDFIDDNEIYDSNIYQISITCIEPTGNFSDLLSISVNKQIEYNTNIKTEDSYKNYEKTINIRLDTGEELTLNDIFTSDASIKNILAQSVYKSFAFEYGLNYENGGFEDGDLDKIDYSKIENEVFNVIAEFNNREEDSFSFMPQIIFINVNNKSYGIELDNCYEYINMYNIVDVDESLYENGNLNKINYIFGRDIFYNYEYFDYVDDYKFLSIYNMYKIKGKPYNSDDIYTKQHTEAIQNNLEKIKLAIKNDKSIKPDKAYIYDLEWISSMEDNTDSIEASIVRIEIDKENYTETVEKIYACLAKLPTVEVGISFWALESVDEFKDLEMISFDFKDIDNDGDYELEKRKEEEEFENIEEPIEEEMFNIE